MSATTIHDILAQFREEELHNRHLGDRFERLICRYLELDPLFSDRFSNVWMWNEWPRKGNTGDILFLVPSLSLLSQSLREWTAEAEIPLHSLAVCSDVNIGKRSNRDAPGDDDTAVSRVKIPCNNIFQPI